jgi:hypothetical protein
VLRKVFKKGETDEASSSLCRQEVESCVKAYKEAYPAACCGTHLSILTCLISRLIVNRFWISTNHIKGDFIFSFWIHLKERDSTGQEEYYSVFLLHQDVVIVAVKKYPCLRNQ